MSWNRLKVPGLLAFGLASIVLAGNSEAAFEVNLLQNPGAEAGTGSPTGGIVPVPDWTPTGDFTAVQYGASGGFPATTDPGPVVRGANFFAGGPDAATSTGTQTIALTPADQAAIAAGGVTFTISGYFGGFASQNDSATLLVKFLDSQNSVLSTASVPTVTAADRNDQTGLLFRTLDGSVSSSTQSLSVELVMNRTDGTYNDGYADNLSVVLHAAAVPEPSSVALLGLGLFAAVGLRRLRREAN